MSEVAVLLHGEKTIRMFVFLLVLGHAAQLIMESFFRQAVINIVHQTRLAFDFEIETTTTTPLRSGQGHMSVGDSVKSSFWFIP